MNHECATVQACILAILPGLESLIEWDFPNVVPISFDSFEKQNLVCFPLLTPAFEVEDKIIEGEDNIIVWTILSFLIFFINDMQKLGFPVQT